MKISDCIWTWFFCTHLLFGFLLWFFRPHRSSYHQPPSGDRGHGAVLRKKHNLFKWRPRLADTGEQFTGHNSGSVCAWFWQYVIPFTWTSPFLLLLLLLLILPLVEQTLAPLSVEWNPRAEEHSGPSWPCRSSQSSRTNEFLSLPSLFFSLSLSFNFSWTIQCLSDRRRDGNSSTEGYYSCCCC